MTFSQINVQNHSPPTILRRADLPISHFQQHKLKSVGRVPWRGSFALLLFCSFALLLAGT